MGTGALQGPSAPNQRAPTLQETPFYLTQGPSLARV